MFDMVLILSLCACCLAIVFSITFLIFTPYGLIKKRIGYKNYIFLLSRHLVDLAVVSIYIAMPFIRKYEMVTALQNVGIEVSLTVNAVLVVCKLVAVASPIFYKNYVTNSSCSKILAALMLPYICWAVVQSLSVSRALLLIANR